MASYCDNSAYYTLMTQQVYNASTEVYVTYIYSALPLAIAAQ